MYSELAAPTPRILKRVSVLYPDLDWTPWMRTFQALEWEGYKLIRYSDGATLLFDIRNDPGEEHDLSQQQPDRLAKMIDGLATWRSKHHARASPGKAPPKVSGKMKRRLEALGYLEDRN